jgi:aminoglycoside/choline kinase family phosphotransferase
LDFRPFLKKLFERPVEPISVVTLKGDASSRKYHRVFMPSGVEPKSLIVMELPEDANSSDEITDGKKPEELPFLNVGRHLADKGVRVPRVYLNAVQDRVLLLEDLGDDLFAAKVHGADFDAMKAWYEAAADLLVKMHGAMWPVPGDCVADTRSFDFNLLRWELDHYREWGLEALSGRTLKQSIRKRLDAAFDALAEEIASLPQGFVHRDYQSRNLMVLIDRPDPKNLAVIDFQDALKGPRVYDLVALLNDSYIDISRRLKRTIIEHYSGKTGIAPGNLMEEFHLVTVQRKLKDGGRFVFIDRVKKNPSFLPFVEGTFKRVRSSLDEIQGHEDLKRALAAADPTRFG